jgi:hypothetical protein
MDGTFSQVVDEILIHEAFPDCDTGITRKNQSNMQPTRDLIFTDQDFLHLLGVPDTACSTHQHPP